MKVFVRPNDPGPCGHYRLIWPSRALQGEFEVEIAERLYVGDILHARADIVVVQRPVDHRLIRYITELRARGIVVVVDVDDDLSCVDPANDVYEWAASLHHNITEACRIASWVTVTTPALAERYGAHGRVSVIPNYVPASYLDIPHKDSRVIGWGGDLGTHPHDLKVVGDALGRLERGGAEVKVVGPPGGVGRALGLTQEPMGTGHVSLDNWPRCIAKLGIGIAPLAPSRFNVAKSRLKPLEYSACGLPWVASPTPEYVALAREGGGWIAASPAEWFDHLATLCTHPEKRHKLADAGREVARANTIEGNAWRWAEAWLLAFEQERKDHHVR
jgi:glycosyltransferase involved in cell wall biosynthesis